MTELSKPARLQHILVATDGSEHSEGAVRVAIDAAAKCSSSLYALTMVLSNPEFEALAPQLVAEGERKARLILDSLEAKASAAGVKLERLVRHGQDPGHQIVSQAAKRNADMIVMGRRGVRGLARMLVGEATVKVCGQAPCPVMVVPRTGELPRKRILLATDGSTYSDSAAQMAARMAALCRLPVTVVSVIMPTHNESRRAEAAESVERVRSALVAQGIDAQAITVPAPRPEVGIVTSAAVCGADLIIVGSHGRSGLLQKVLIGSVSERVLGDATCPVMVVKGT